MSRVDLKRTVDFYDRCYCTLEQRKENYLDESIKVLQKSKTSLKNFKENYTASIAQIRQLYSKDAGYDNKMELQSSVQVYLDILEENIKESLRKLRCIKRKRREAVAKVSVDFPLDLEANSDLHEESYELHMLSHLCMFAVEEELRFCWDGLEVLSLGILQTLAGVHLVAFSSGILTSFWILLIIEGISDCISGTEAMATRKFSWKSWFVYKMINIGVLLTSRGIANLIIRGFRLDAKDSITNSEVLPYILRNQMAVGSSAILKERSLKFASKEIVQQAIMFGVRFAEDHILDIILKKCARKIQRCTKQTLKGNIEKEPLKSTVNHFVLYHVRSLEELEPLLDPTTKSSKSIKHIFENVVQRTLDDFTSSPFWRNQTFVGIRNVIEMTKIELTDELTKQRTILNITQTAFMAILGVYASSVTISILRGFPSKLTENINTFLETAGFETHDALEVRKKEEEQLEQLRELLADRLSVELGRLVFQTFHDRFSRHLVGLAQRQLNAYPNRHIRRSLKINRTLDGLYQ